MYLRSLVSQYSSDNKSKKQQQQQHYYIQKYHNSSLLAEYVIVENKPYFAVAKSNGVGSSQITLEESITPDKTTTQLKPYELMSYINKPYIFESRQDFDDFVEKAQL
jgi:hypothetical protein